MALRKMALIGLWVGWLLGCILLAGVATAQAQWATRDERFPLRGPWLWTLPRELPELYREFNGIDFGHAHIAETLLSTQDSEKVEKARIEVLDFIFSSPEVQPDEEQVAPVFTRMAWEVQKTFTWTHKLHRALYDLFASDAIPDKEAAYRAIMKDYLEKPEAITSHSLDLHGKLWSFPESKAFRDKYPKFNTQIWVYHWLQAAAYDVQLMGGAATQRSLMPRAIAFYHAYLRTPPVEWRMMPMMMEVAPEFTRRFPEAATVFDNLHMLHDNVDDVLSRPDLYPTNSDKRKRILEIMHIYQHRYHVGSDRYADYHLKEAGDGHAGDHAGHGAHTQEGLQAKDGAQGAEMDMGEMSGPRPLSVYDAIGVKPPAGHEEHSQEAPRQSDAQMGY